MPIDVSADRADAIAARFAARGGQPGLAYGIVAGGELVHAGGCGERWLGGPAPDADTVFRIASMTKSFTATLVLLLRDRGALRLDDPAVDYVTELRGLELPTADCPPVTIRQLLTMTAGFPTDDPWGDRQQGLDPATFAWLLASRRRAVRLGTGYQVRVLEPGLCDPRQGDRGGHRDRLRAGGPDRGCSGRSGST